jgi:predicted dinucleotide-binding enzyme
MTVVPECGLCKASRMRIGIIGGTGPAGSGLALRMSVAGHQVLIGSRSKERSQETVAELTAQWPDH